MKRFVLRAPHHLDAAPAGALVRDRLRGLHVTVEDLVLRLGDERLAERVGRLEELGDERRETWNERQPRLPLRLGDLRAYGLRVGDLARGGNGRKFDDIHVGRAVLEKTQGG